MRRSSSGFTWIELVIVIAIVFVLWAILQPCFIRPREQSQYTACQANLKAISTALDLYATNNGRRYPASLNALIPKYLEKLPVCPVAGTDTYAAGYASNMNPNRYTIFCSGTNHTKVGAGANMPQYSSTTGLNK